MKKLKASKNMILIAAAILLAGGLVWWGRPSGKNISQESPDTLQPDTSGALSAEELSYDFGTISMAGGNVTRIFKIKNAGTMPVTISKIYTSCMCTTATLITASKQLGPFGMAGHGLIPSINEKLGPGEEANIAVVFDPQAHGPAGIGRIERAVRVEYESGMSLDLMITATVTP